MKRKTVRINLGLITFLTILFSYGDYLDSSMAADKSAIIIDHTCTDLSKIPMKWIEAAKARIKLHYAHTSHGGQILVGMQEIAKFNSICNFTKKSGSLPVTTNSLAIFDGQENDSYITPEEYWASEAGRRATQSVFDHSKKINVSMWSWCCQQDQNSQETTQKYLDAMNDFEKANPEVVFIYMTGNAQKHSPNRYARNEQIRKYCRVNKKVLFDFADIDCWYNGKQHLVNGIPVEHPRYRGNEAAHTTRESCRMKGNAFWWMMARIVGLKGI
ncbi:MAG: hypothetical protein ABIK53_03060 [bacterium]